jgi:hypothetical protein
MEWWSQPCTSEAAETTPWGGTTVRTRATIRRAGLICAGALAVLPLAAGPAAAQSAEDFCEQVPGELEPVFGPICEGLEDGDDGDDGENGDGPTGTPLDELLEALDPEQLGQLCDEAPEELEAVFGPICDALTGEDGEDEVDEDPGGEEQEDPAPSPEPTPEADTTDADSSGDLPVTGGAAGLVGLALLGAGVGLRRFTARG